MSEKDHKFVPSYLMEVERIARDVSKDDIEKTIAILHAAWKNGNAVFTAGNGGSASTATHFAADLNEYVSSEAPKKFKAFALVDNIPLVSALTNDEGWGEIYSYQLDSFM